MGFYLSDQFLQNPPLTKKPPRNLRPCMKTDNNKINIKKSKTIKIDRVETSLKESSRDLSLFKFKSGGVVALVLFVVFGLLNSLYEGKVVAKLPYKPFVISGPPEFKATFCI
ncbi:hypothetical protein JHK82_017125 [Glycine max]|uniref:Uncharacterized protein n=1 Tax=Glycine max TaxID=3847 RepID=K7KYS2_SOYBN|nr:hypothetical protein JHK87_017066 [Glycine soja]KAG5036336.1 hypothetical protein JHK86_017176 [Glycine max]KAG5141430.1 hypothetical protein JHK82_017125 [Glycine max]KAH1084574.1 hypothetical protein GYH30_016936 [Glycine max]KHN39389.1 Transmembrane and coiled-coil domains protein 1 [Glycine soja]